MSNIPENCPVTIAVRERPEKNNLQNDMQSKCYQVVEPNIIVMNEINGLSPKIFPFDNVMGPHVSQDELFIHLVEPLVNKVVQGFNCTILAYGQTGTGKSYTMGLNTDNFEDENVGIIPRCLKKILNSTNNENAPLAEREYHASFLEIYNEKLFDLLSETTNEPITAKGYRYTGGIRKPLTSLEEGYNLLINGNKNRHVRPTKMNSQSSRSHAIFTIHVRSISEDGATTSCLNLVDLAGSEGVRRTGHQGVALSEGVNINQGLFVFGKVVQAITSGNKLIPYRDSVLSSVLQDSLNPKSYLTLLACISPHKEDISETVSTLRFAQSAKHLKHTPEINTIISELKKNKGKTPFKIKSNILTTANAKRKNIPMAAPNGTFRALKTNFHSNTFCTPNKIRRIDANKANYTALGLTPKEKAKSYLPRSQALQYDAFNRESLFDHYNESIDSRFSLNVSASTTLSHLNKNRSPPACKCLGAIENVMDAKMMPLLEMMQSIKSLTNTSKLCNLTPKCSPAIKHKTTSSIITDSVKKELRLIIRREIILNSYDPNTSPSTSETGEASPFQMFATSSPVFKKPNAVGHIKNENLKEKTSLSNLTNSMEVDNVSPTTSKSRRSSQNRLNLLPTRRSLRLSLKSINDQRRKSTRLSTKLESINEKMNEDSITKSRRKTKNAVVSNDVIRSYIDNTTTKKNTNQGKHKKAILDFLNSGTMKELQILPHVGVKTAYQIVTHRTLNGKFKSLAQVEKLPIWRGTAWQRFSKANMLT